ncbi:hypothetical protein [Lysinibacillus capsici]|uniref:hypothetical protein n=1 Tax=Lysinibacillus capsici TaxID=2115968 RepID=UPI0034E2C79E
MEKLTIEELEVLTVIRNEKGVEIVEVMNDQELSRYRINCVEAIERNEKYIENGTCEALKKVKKENNEKLQEYITYIDEKVNKKDGLAIINEFLNNWKDRAFKFYVNSKKELTKIEDIEQYYKEADEKGLKFYKRENYAMMRRYEERKQFLEKFSKNSVGILTYGDDNEKFLKSLNQTLNFMVMEKRLLIIGRVNNAAGNILDASGLYLGDNGEINGKIKGEKATVNVRTVYAGGYNVQCLHYRVLVKGI